MENNSNSSTQSSASQNTGTSQNGGFNLESLAGMLGGTNIQEAVKKYGGSATKAISGLTTTQKVLGGAALLLGATYLARKKGTMGLLGKVGTMGSKMNKKKGKY